MKYKTAKQKKNSRNQKLLLCIIEKGYIKHVADE